ncbi:MAG: SMR family transporter [Micrococcaceae bacterium]|nr:SMR family transporter [Micrococcaceae bacterium]
MMWAFLGVAIVAEVAATMSLRAAVTGSKAWYVPVGLGYLLAFSMLSFALQAGMGIGVAYGIWAATGVALTATLSKWIFDEPLTPVMAAGIALIAAGVLLVELGAAG